MSSAADPAAAYTALDLPPSAATAAAAAAAAATSHAGYDSFIPEPASRRPWNLLYASGVSNTAHSGVKLATGDERKQPVDDFHLFRVFCSALDLADGPARDRALTLLARDFVNRATLLGKIIISELSLPVEARTIRPIVGAGIAGGQKFKAGGLYFKLAADNHNLYGGSLETAAKVASHELRAADRAFAAARNCGSRVRTPLVAVIDFNGFRLVAMPVLPIAEDTLVVGSADGGITNVARSKELVAELQALCDEVGTRAPALDMELHDVAGQLLLLDLGRALPSEDSGTMVHLPPTKGGFLCRLIRPELLGQILPLKLHPDAASAFMRDDPRIEELRADLRAAGRHLLDVSIPRVVEELLAAVTPRTRWQDVKFSSVLHKHGVNMRHLGLVSTRLSSSRHAQHLVYIECVARTLKNVLRDELRSATLSLRSSSSFATRETIAHHLTQRLRDVGPARVHEQEHEQVQRRFGKQAVASIISLAELHAVLAVHVLPRLGYELATGVNNDRSFVTHADIVEGAVRVKEITSLARNEAAYLASLAEGEDAADGRRELRKRTADLLETALLGDPNNQALRRDAQIARALVAEEVAGDFERADALLSEIGEWRLLIELWTKRAARAPETSLNSGASSLSALRDARDKGPAAAWMEAAFARRHRAFARIALKIKERRVRGIAINVAECVDGDGAARLATHLSRSKRAALTKLYVEAAIENQLEMALAYIELGIWASKSHTLHEFVEADQIDAVRIALLCGADPAVLSERDGVLGHYEFDGKRFRPPLALARSVECVKVLLKYGAQPDQTFGASSAFLTMSLQAVAVPRLRIILDHDPAALFYSDKNGATAVHYALSRRHLDTLQFLLREGALPAAANVLGEVPLHKACQKGPVACARAVLEASPASVNAQTVRGLTPLMTAIVHASTSDAVDIINLLLAEASTDLKVRATALFERQAVHLAAERGDLAVCEALFSHERVLAQAPRIFSREDALEMTPLLIAVQQNHDVGLVRRIKEATGENWVNHCDKQRHFAAHFAARNNSPALLELFMPLQVNKQSRVTGRETPLHVAVRSGSVDAIRFLLAQPDIDPSIQDAAGETVLAAAVSSRSLAVVQAVLEKVQPSNDDLVRLCDLERTSASVALALANAAASRSRLGQQASRTVLVKKSGRKCDVVEPDGVKRSREGGQFTIRYRNGGLFGGGKVKSLVFECPAGSVSLRVTDAASGAVTAIISEEGAGARIETTDVDVVELFEEHTAPTQQQEKKKAGGGEEDEKETDGADEEKKEDREPAGAEPPLIRLFLFAVVGDADGVCEALDDWPAAAAGGGAAPDELRLTEAVGEYLEREYVRASDLVALSSQTGRTPLHVAAASGHADVVRALLERRPDLRDVPDGGGFTAAHLAAAMGRVECLRALKRVGASMAKALTISCRKGHAGVVEELVVDESADAKNEALLAAATRGHVGVAKVLLKHGASPAVRDDFWGREPLHYAAIEGNVPLAEILLDAGAQCDALDSHEVTPLIEAAVAGHVEVARVLLAHGADKNHREKQYGTTALEEARNGAHDKLVELLMNA